MTRLPLAAVALVALAGPAPAAPAADVADLFPPGTLAFAELHRPAELGPQLAAAFKGTALEDSIPLVHGRKDGAATPAELKAKTDLALLALLGAPELAGEFRKLGGAAAGLVGFSDRGEPELCFAVLTGDSAAAGLLARAFVTATPDLRQVAEVSKVPVFQVRRPVLNYDPNGQPKLSDAKPTEGAYEPTFAYTPGLFVAGTSKAALAPAIRRFRGEDRGALAEAAGFKAAAAEFRKPGLFVYADAPRLFAAFDQANARRGLPADLGPLARVRLLAGDKALAWLAGHAGFRDGGLAVAVGARLDPAQKSPIGDLLAGPAVKADGLHHARNPAALAVTFSLPDKNRASAVLELLDAVAKGGGELGRLPSDMAKDSDAAHKPPVAELLAKVRAVTVAVPKGGGPLPLFVFHAEDAAAAEALEAFAPKLLAAVAGAKEPARRSSEVVGGVDVFTVAGTGLPWNAATHYARKGSTFALGADRKQVAAALGPDAAASVAGDKGLGAPPGGALVGTGDLGALLAALDARPGPDGAVRPAEPPVRGGAPRPPGVPDPAQKEWTALLSSFGELPPNVLTARRTGGVLRLEFFQPNAASGGLAPVIRAGLDWYDRLASLRDPNRPDPGLLPPLGFPR